MKILNGTKTIAIDSNILTYFVEATEQDYDPQNDIDSRRDERVASLRIPLYSAWYAILPTVQEEYLKIKKVHWLDLHINVAQVFHEYQDEAFNKIEVKKRADFFNQHHKGAKEYKDCMIAAEAEFLSDTTVLLSNDTAFINNVSPLTKGLLIMRPTEFIEKFEISNNALRISPEKTNPLYKKVWWRF